MPFDEEIINQAVAMWGDANDMLLMRDLSGFWQKIRELTSFINSNAPPKDQGGLDAILTPIRDAINHDWTTLRNIELLTGSQSLFRAISLRSASQEGQSSSEYASQCNKALAMFLDCKMKPNERMPESKAHADQVEMYQAFMISHAKYYLVTDLKMDKYEVAKLTSMQDINLYLRGKVISDDAKHIFELYLVKDQICKRVPPVINSNSDLEDLMQMKTGEEHGLLTAIKLRNYYQQSYDNVSARIHKQLFSIEDVNLRKSFYYEYPKVLNAKKLIKEGALININPRDLQDLEKNRQLLEIINDGSIPIPVRNQKALTHSKTVDANKVNASYSSDIVKPKEIKKPNKLLFFTIKNRFNSLKQRVRQIFSQTKKM
jgi:hypothetical protein